MTQLHELIAVEPDLKQKAIKDRDTLTAVLGQAQKFMGEVRTYQPLEEMGETFPDEVTQVTSTVPGVISDFVASFKGYLDVTLIKEMSNARTSADVTLDGAPLFSELPSPALLNLEARLNEIKAFYSALPVLDQTEVWHYDENQMIWVSEPRKTFRARKTLRNHVKAEATKEHPAQVEIYTEDVRVGEWTKVVKSGAVTARQKKEMLDRIDKLALAVKKARQRANSLELDDSQKSFASKLFEFINGGIV